MRYTGAWRLHNFVTIAMKTIKSTRLVTSETGGKNPHFKRAGRQIRKHTRLER